MKTTHQDKVMNAVNDICYDINRRIKAMNYEEELQLRQYLIYEFDNYQKDCEMFMLYDMETKDIAEILEVNETCIFDVLVDLGFAAYEDEEKN
jgi:hypothetical protein